MDEKDMFEQAYKNGYEKGKQDAEEEIRILKQKRVNIFERLEAYERGYEKGKQDAVKWIPTIGRKPTKADADKYGRVLAMEYGMITIVNYRGPINYPDKFPYWLPLPEPPKGD